MSLKREIALLEEEVEAIICVLETSRDFPEVKKPEEAIEESIKMLKKLELPYDYADIYAAKIEEAISVLGAVVYD